MHLLQLTKRFLYKYVSLKDMVSCISSYLLQCNEIFILPCPVFSFLWPSKLVLSFSNSVWVYICYSCIANIRFHLVHICLSQYCNMSLFPLNWMSVLSKPGTDLKLFLRYAYISHHNWKLSKYIWIRKQLRILPSPPLVSCSLTFLLFMFIFLLLG